jgi:hypothetical protein
VAHQSDRQLQIPLFPGAVLAVSVHFRGRFMTDFVTFERPWSYFREGQEVPINPVSALPNPLGGRLGNPYLEVVIGSIS